MRRCVDPGATVPGAARGGGSFLDLVEAVPEAQQQWAGSFPVTFRILLFMSWLYDK
jgi:hypothetical protein